MNTNTNANRPRRNAAADAQPRRLERFRPSGRARQTENL